MCGIAGILDLTGRHAPPVGVTRAMADALVHRGPDEDGYFDRPAVALASRRLSIVGLADGRQPIRNEDGSVWVVYNGELFDYPERRAALEAKGHRFVTHTDTELLPHLWEDHGEAMLETLRGQFALALWDERRRTLVLARDRWGICPLFWTVQRPDGPGGPEYLLFASEIKALFASGLVEARPDIRGLNHVFTFFAVPGPVTCFEGVNMLLPGRYLVVRPGMGADSIAKRTFYQFDFPDRGQEVRHADQRQLVDRFEEVFLGSVQRRLRADVPVVSYLSGGVDSSVVVALAGKVMNRPIPAFTIGIHGEPSLNEENEATVVARHVGTRNHTVVPCDRADVLATYPELIQAAEVPVIDTACAALLMLAREVRRQNYKVALTGEGSDEWLAGYPWFKIHRLLGALDVVPGVPVSMLLRRAFLRLTRTPQYGWEAVRRTTDALGGPNAWMEVYGLMSLSKLRFFSRAMWDRLGDHQPFEDLDLPLERMRQWHPLNRSLLIGGRVMLPGMLLASKGDRVAMHSSVETRYPFLDEDVFAFLAGLHPRWKLHGFRDKYLLRLLAERYLPKEIAWRRKVMFRAPMDTFHLEEITGRGGRESWADQLLSPESLRKTGYFDAEAVRHWGKAFRKLRPGSVARTAVELGLVGVVATQLWHHTYIDGTLTSELPKAVGSGQWAVGRDHDAGQRAGVAGS